MSAGFGVPRTGRIIIVCLIMMFWMSFSAAETVKLFTHIETDGTSFAPGEEANIYVIPVNSEPVYLNDLKVHLNLPESIMLVNTILPDEPEKMNPYEEKVFQYVVRNVSSQTLPSTGDSMPLFFVLVILLLFACIGIGIISRNFQRMLSLLLVTSMTFLLHRVPEVKAEDYVTMGDSGKLQMAMGDQTMVISASSTARIAGDMDELDEDGDRLSAFEERYLFGTDDAKADTDGDGLTDYQEVGLFLTDPLVPDTDGNGVSDAEEDADQDGLTNVYEINYGYDPLKPDTDGDGLKDGTEVNQYHTNPLNADHDSDGMLDGFEIEHREEGLDPLVANHIISSITKGYPQSEASSAVFASVKVNNITGAQAQSLSVREVPDDHIFIGKNLEGWIGNGCEITMDSAGGSANQLSAELTMFYDKSLIGENFEPAIFYMDEENQTLEEVTGQINNQDEGYVKAPLSHFSLYVLKNKKNKGTAVKADRIQLPDPNAGIVLMMDVEPNANSEATTLLKETTDILDKTLTDRSTNPGALLNKPWNLVYSTPDYYKGMNMFLEENITENNANKTIYLVTSNPAKQISLQQAESLAGIANNQGICVNILLVVKNQNYTENMLQGVKKLTSATNGKCYLVSDKSDVAFSYTAYENYNDDKNGDGIYDGDMWAIWNGDIRHEALGKVLSGYTYDQIQSNADLDGDGVKNGFEIQVKEKNGKKYVYLKSDPKLPDTDFDGLSDKEDLNCLSNIRWVSWKDEGIDDHFDVKLHMDYRWFDDNREFNQDIAVTSSLFASLSYNGQGYSLNGKTRKEALSDFIGMKDVKTVYTTKYMVHNSMATIGHHEFEYQKKKHMVLFIGVTGYWYNGWEWVSNFTVGDDSNTASDETNKWPEWQDKQNHLGFDVAASMMIEKIEEYLGAANIQEIIRSVDVVDIWTMGHSRGGAVSNLIAAKISDGQLKKIPRAKYQNRIFAYDFATPRNTQNAAARSYKGIYNIINLDDPVPMLPLQAWGFERFGKDMVFRLYERAFSDEMDSIFKRNFGEGYLTIQGPGLTVQMKTFGLLASNKLHKFYFTMPDTLDRAFSKSYISIAKNRKELYREDLAIDANTGSKGLQRFNRGRIRDFLDKELQREEKFTLPKNAPENVKKYYRSSIPDVPLNHPIEGKKYRLYVRPEYTMVLMGKALDSAIHGDLDRLREFADICVWTVPHTDALWGLARMAIGSGILATHITPAYYIGTHELRY